MSIEFSPKITTLLDYKNYKLYSLNSQTSTINNLFSMHSWQILIWKTFRLARVQISPHYHRNWKVIRNVRVKLDRRIRLRSTGNPCFGVIAYGNLSTPSVVWTVNLDCLNNNCYPHTTTSKHNQSNNRFPSLSLQLTPIHQQSLLMQQWDQISSASPHLWLGIFPDGGLITRHWLPQRWYKRSPDTVEWYCRRRRRTSFPPSLPAKPLLNYATINHALISDHQIRQINQISKKWLQPERRKK
jgi:hypothetical protein